MALQDQKLTERDSLTVASDNDLQHIVDVSDTTDSPEGTSKKITWANIKDSLFSFLKMKDVYEDSYVGRLGQVVSVGLDNATGEVGLKFTSMPTYNDVLGGNAIITGGVVHLYGLTYRAWASKYVINNVVYTTYVANTVTLNDGDATDPRFDSIAVQVDTNEPPNATIQVIEGTPATNPLKPTINLQSQVEISFVNVPALATVDPDITLEQIYDENTGEPTEWDNTVSTVGIVLDWATDPYIGTKCVRIPTLASADLTWQNDALFDYTSDDNLVFAMKSASVSEQNTQINIDLLNSATQEYYNINLLLDNLLSYGFDSSLSTWQIVEIPLSAFASQFNPSQFDVISFQITNTPILYLDWIGVQGGVNTPIIGGNYAILDQPNAFTSTGLNSFASNVEVGGKIDVLGSGSFGGDVGIGTTTPIGGLHVANDGDGIWVSDIDEGVTASDSSYLKQSGDTTYLVNKNSGSLRLGTNNFNNMFTIAPTGDVGIGTTSPSEKLDVNGSIISNNSFLLQSGTTLIGGIVNTGGALDIQSDSTRDVSIGSATNPQSLFVEGSNGNLGIGTTSPGYKLEVNAGTTNNIAKFESSDGGGVITVKDSGGEVGFSNVGNDMFLKTSSSQTNQMSILNSGNVGIGTTTPAAKLEVDKGGEGTYLIVGGDNVSNARALTFTSSTTGGSVGALHTISAISNSGAIALATAGSERMYINNAGAVKFNAYGAGTLVTDASGNITVSSGGGAGGPYLPLSAGSGEGLTGQLWFTGTTDTNRKIFFTNAGAYAKGLMDAASYGFQVSGSEKLTISSAGNVGIGTITPSAKLAVKQDGISWGDGIRLEAAASTNYWENIIDGSNNLSLGYNGSTKVLFDDNGNVGIGTTSPGAKLTVNETSTVTAAVTIVTARYGISLQGAGTSNTQYLLNLQSNGGSTDVMRVQSSGNVGIGTGTPASKLQVDGGIQMADDADVASADKVGTQRYRADANNSYVDMCMQTGASTYAWINITQNNW